ncbi:hypothetical protein GCM10007924_32450 [Sneathiella chinensis]|uniref:Uncharacterized protein n=1 Tax=Sneathiella chinensis TaxID=349750 RepID=A0ABQ5U8M0_9PROT|nr:hypothetical protein GCM10007924_32450 [Sneathiella chinensis]
MPVLGEPEALAVRSLRPGRVVNRVVLALRAVPAARQERSATVVMAGTEGMVLLPTQVWAKAAAAAAAAAVGIMVCFSLLLGSITRLPHPCRADMAVTVETVQAFSIRRPTAAAVVAARAGMGFMWWTPGL